MYVIGVDCGPDFGTPSDGTVNDEEGTTFESRVLFSCDPDFTLLGNEFRECLANGSWSDIVPTCLGNNSVTLLF